MSKKRARLLLSILFVLISLVTVVEPRLFPNNTDGEVKSSYSEQPTVVKVVDGDTIDVSVQEETYRLRLIGINTPETVDPRRPVECFGKEASQKAKDMLLGKVVRLESDPTQSETDKYQRLLRYVFLEDGTNFNLYMISQGYAYEYTYGSPYKYQQEFKQAQEEARVNARGLWGNASCPISQ